MATAWLAAKTGEGDQLGQRGAFPTEMWFSQLDFATDNPIIEVAIRRPMDSQHPDPSFRSAVVVDYQKIEATDNPLIWRVLVIYQTDQMMGRGSFGGWRVRTSWQTTTNHLTRSLPDLDSRGQPMNDGRLIGPHHYRRPDPEAEVGSDPPTHIAPDPTTGTDIELVQTDAIRPVGFDAIDVAMHFTFTNTVMRMHWALLREIKAQLGRRINSKPWKGFPAGTLLFTNFGQDEEAGTDPDRLTPVFKYPVVVEFAFKEDGWSPAEFVETYQTPGGIEVAVQRIVADDPRSGGPPGLVLETVSYRVYKSAPIHKVFTWLGTGEPDDPARSVIPTVRP